MISCLICSDNRLWIRLIFLKTTESVVSDEALAVNPALNICRGNWEPTSITSCCKCSIYLSNLEAGFTSKTFTSNSLSVSIFAPGFACLNASACFSINCSPASAKWINIIGLAYDSNILTIAFSTLHILVIGLGSFTPSITLVAATDWNNPLPHTSLCLLENLKWHKSLGFNMFCSPSTSCIYFKTLPCESLIISFTVVISTSTKSAYNGYFSNMAFPVTTKECVASSNLRSNWVTFSHFSIFFLAFSFCVLIFNPEPNISWT